MAVTGDTRAVTDLTTKIRVVDAAFARAKGSREGLPNQITIRSRQETEMSDYLAVLVALFIYGSFFYFIWTMQ
jgi:hypothetical protein